MTYDNSREPTMTIQEAKRYLQSEASLTRRMIYAALLLLDVGMLVLLTALWSTEPTLPLRTHVAFGSMVTVAVAWSVFFGWVLLRRRPLLALDRVVAGRLALGATTLFLLGGMAIAALRGHWPGMLLVALVGGMFVAAAAVVLVRAVRTRRLLERRREELLGQLRTEAQESGEDAGG